MTTRRTTWLLSVACLATGCAIDFHGYQYVGEGGAGGSGSAGGGGQGAQSPVDDPWQLVQTGAHHTCAATVSGRVYCWGDGSEGQLGLDTTETFVPPSRVIEPRTCNEDVGGSVLLGVSALALGTHHTCAASQARDRVWCWGSNADGQLGPDAAIRELQPFGVHHPDTGTCTFAVDRIAAGHDTSCVIERGTLTPRCWGNPALAITVTQQTQHIAIGSDHACAIMGDGVECWGSNAIGQLARPESVPESDTPLPVEGLPDGFPMRLEAGKNHTCAIYDVAGNRQIYCWGANGAGQIHDPEPDVRSPAVLDIGNFSPDLLALGDRHTCYAEEGGYTKCIGDNSEGQLGNGDQPTDQVMNVNETEAITAFGDHACALTREDATGHVSVLCWGDNSDGQVSADVRGDVVREPTAITVPP